MRSRREWRSRLIVCAALATGFAGGCFFMSLHQARPLFLHGAEPIAEKEETNSAGGDTVSYYSIGGNWLDVFARAMKELPHPFAHDAFMAGVPAKVITVPRVVNGRLQLFYPPQEEITFIPRKLALSQNGRVLAYGTSGLPWTGIQVREYRDQRPLDGIVEWFRKGLKV